MACPSKKLCGSDEVVLYEQFQENEYSDISESEYSSDSEINVKISSCEQSVGSEEDENVSDNITMQHGIQTKSVAE
jgi:hypothetical protein